MRNLYVDTQKNISTLFGSKVKAHYVAVATILDFALKRPLFNNNGSYMTFRNIITEFPEPKNVILSKNDFLCSL